MSETKKPSVISGKQYWRSLDELAQTEKFTEFLHREFPEGASELVDPISRRGFIKLLGASLALAGLTSCRRPAEKIVPYVKHPLNVIPGHAKFYASTMPLGGSNYGVLVRSHEGRPNKIEGNPAHSGSLGATNVFVQAATLSLFDPDRSQHVTYQGLEKSWEEFVAFWQGHHAGLLKNRGEGLAILSEAFASPTLARLVEELRGRMPQAKFVAYEPVNQESLLAGIKAATGRYLVPIYHFEKAKVVLSLDSDFLNSDPYSTVYARHFASGRRLEDPQATMNRLYVVENSFTVTGGMADHRLRLPVQLIGPFAVALAKQLRAKGLALQVADTSSVESNVEFDKKWLEAVANDLVENRGRSLVLAGDRLAAPVHALIVAINDALGNLGQTIEFVEPRDTQLSSTEGLQGLTKYLSDGKINTLIILGGNPVFNAPGDLKFGEAIKKAGIVIHCGGYQDETAAASHWHVPQAHFLESWGDARSLDGAPGVIQPLIEPLFGAVSSVDFLQMVVHAAPVSAYDAVRSTWKRVLGGDFEKQWQKLLHDGIYTAGALPKVRVDISQTVVARFLKQETIQGTMPTADNIEVVFRPSFNIYDGRFANNGWLQELPCPVTKVTWDNAAIISPKTAEALGLKIDQSEQQNRNSFVVIEHQGRSIEIPVWVLPGQADFSITLSMGYGRTHAGRVGNGVGFNVYPLRSATSMALLRGAKVSKSGKTYALATTQDHNSMEGRPIVREATLEEFNENPKFAAEMVELPPLVSMFKEPSYTEGHQWGMVIDLNVCNGCNACAIACQSENNIPVVGKDQVDRGREMAWLRLDRYFNGSVEEPEMVMQPVACQHCENAPCEQVCPVAATVHDKEGLNAMVYNRCIGTRYCMNNCPYKVRRFNFYNFTKDTPEIVKMAMNPEVTVRSRGVMEKCSFCVQRISAGKHQAKMENRPLRDGEVVTACQQACPVDAITFGDINDPNSRVAKLKQNERRYDLLAELNTKPRTSYLAKVRNPNPALKSGQEKSHE